MKDEFMKKWAVDGMPADKIRLINALSEVTDYASRNVCLHSSTHRGGAIWEICDECGAQWADDRNPKQDHEHEYPKEIQNAYKVLNEIGELPVESKQRTREEEIEDFERMMSDDYKNMEKIEKSGENYMHSRTNSALWVWLARAKLDF